jgi:hypothetical protein
MEFYSKYKGMIITWATSVYVAIQSVLMMGKTAAQSTWWKPTINASVSDLVRCKICKITQRGHNKTHHWQKFNCAQCHYLGFYRAWPQSEVLVKMNMSRKQDALLNKSHVHQI